MALQGDFRGVCLLIKAFEISKMGNEKKNKDWLDEVIKLTWTERRGISVKLGSTLGIQLKWKKKFLAKLSSKVKFLLNFCLIL